MNRGQDRELVLKNLEFTERCIDRMATNSFRIKAWLSSSLLFFLGLTRGDVSSWLSACVLVYIGVLWWMDSYYLRLERAYRQRYSRISKLLDEESDCQSAFSLMSLDVTTEMENNPLCECAFNKINRVFYPVSLGIVILVTFVAM
ncbi:MAG: hypothetical protein MJZ38_02565 [archaeon]|nr:hypothetical protein [archaeon]